MAEGTNARARTHDDARREEDIRLDLAIGFEDGVVGQKNRFWRGHADRPRQREGAQPRLHRRFRRRQLGAAVDAHHLDLVRFEDGAADTFGLGERRHIGEVIFLLGVVVPQHCRPAEEILGVGGENPCVAQWLAAFARIGIFELDDAVQQAVCVQDHAAIFGDILRAEPDHRDAGLCLRRERGFERREGHQRHVAVRDDQHARKVGKRASRHTSGVTGAELGVLDHAPGAQLLCEGANFAAFLVGDHDDALDLGLAHGGDHLPEHRKAGDRMHDLGRRGFHPLALPCGQYDSRARHACSINPYSLWVK